MICREMVHYESFGMWEKSIPVGIVFRGSRVGIPYLSSLRRKRSDVLRTSQLRRRRESVFIRPHDILRTTNAHWDGNRGHEGQFYAVF